VISNLPAGPQIREFGACNQTPVGYFRQSAALRRMIRETSLDPGCLVLPLFVRSGRKLRRPIKAMPGVFQLSPDELLRDAQAAFRAGVPAVLLFGIPDKKDAKAKQDAKPGDGKSGAKPDGTPDTAAKPDDRTLDTELSPDDAADNSDAPPNSATVPVSRLRD